LQRQGSNLRTCKEHVKGPFKMRDALDSSTLELLLSLVECC
jgi:hypothetical protein